VKRLVSLIILFFVLQEASAQVDPHFSQYYAYPLWLNPALTGVIDGQVRLTSNARDQWVGISKGYRTSALSGDFKAADRVGLGFNFIDQAAGSAGYNYFAAYSSFSYQLPLSSDGGKINLGLQVGFISRGFDAAKLQLDDQYNPLLGFDPSIVSPDSHSSTHATVFDASAGIFYYNDSPQNTTNFYAGFSVAHIALSQDPLVTIGAINPIPLRLTFHTGLRMNMSDRFVLTPHLIYMKDQTNQIRAVGLSSEFKFQDSQSFIAGGMIRINDAAVINAGFRLDKLLLGLSYDFNTSGLSAATNGQGGIELSMSYIFPDRAKSYGRICPSF